MTDNITIPRATVQQALEALENSLYPQQKQLQAISALRAALAEPEQEPVAWPIETNNQVEALAKHCGWDNRRYMTPADYQIWCDRMREFSKLATPPQRKPLTDDQADQIISGLQTCHHQSSKREFLKVWLRDWAAHGIKEQP